MRFKILLMGLLLFTTAILLSCSSDSKSMVKKYVKLHNLNNVEEMLNYISEDAEYRIGGNLIKDDKKGIREILEFDSVVNSQITIQEMETSDDKTTCLVTETSDYYRLLDIEKIRKKIRFTLSDTGFTAIEVVRNKDDLNILMENFNKFSEWANQNRKDQFGELLYQGEFLYGERGAESWLALLKQWRENKNMK